MKHSRWKTVLAGTTNVTSIQNLIQNDYARVTITGTAKKGIQITNKSGTNLLNTKIQGTGKSISLNVRNTNVGGKIYARLISVSQNDNTSYCTCDECLKVYDEKGGPSGVVIRFVNKIVDAVAEKYPNVMTNL